MPKKPNKQNHSTRFTAAYQTLSRNWAAVTDPQEHDTFKSLFCRGVTCEINFLPPEAIRQLPKGDGSNKHTTKVERTGSTDFVRCIAN